MINHTDYSWKYSIPFFRNTFVLKSIAFVVLMASFFFLILIFLVMAIQENLAEFVRFLPFFGILFLFISSLFLLATWIVIGDQYHINYVIDKDGITMFSDQGNIKQILKITKTLGLAKNNLIASGAGMLASNSDEYFIGWEYIKKVTAYPKKNMIQIKQSQLIQMQLFCTSENYEIVQDLISSHSI